MSCGYRELVSVKDIGSKAKLKEFDCGNVHLNEFLVRYAAKNDELGIGRTFVSADENGTVLGYFTLATAQVSYQEIPEDFRCRLPRYPIPALRLARLAVDKRFQGEGLGKKLLSLVFMKAVQVADITGLYLIIVDAKESSKSFYKKYGFLKLFDGDLSYFMPIDTVRRAMLR